MQAVFGKLTAPEGTEPPVVELGNNFRNGAALGIHIKHQADRWRRFRIYHKFFSGGIRFVPQRPIAPGALAFLCTCPLATQDVLGKLEAVIFSHTLKHAFQNNALRAVWDAFSNIHHFYTILFTAVFIESDLLTVTPEAVYLPQYNDVKLFLSCIFKHLLELLTVITTATLSPVNIFMHYRVAVSRCVFVRLRELPFY